MDEDTQHYSLSVRDRGSRNYKDQFFADEVDAVTKMVREAGFMCQHGYRVADIGSRRIEVEDVDDSTKGTEFLVRD